jgi:hypothetical protein
LVNYCLYLLADLLNDIFLTIKTADLTNYADDNTISAFSKSLDEVLDILTKETQTSIDWFNQNNMKVNPDKFQAMILTSGRTYDKPNKINIGNVEITIDEWVKLLGTYIDDNLNFNQHISELIRKAARQINVLKRKTL